MTAGRLILKTNNQEIKQTKTNQKKKVVVITWQSKDAGLKLEAFPTSEGGKN